MTAGDFDGLPAWPVLNLCGYNVGQQDDLSRDERHLILENAMDRGICGKAKVISHLQWLINSRGRDPGMEIACEKWRDDLEWARDYRVGDLSGDA